MLTRLGLRACWRGADIRLIGLVLVAVLGTGCLAETDKEVYELNEAAHATFGNFIPHTPVFLGGCGIFVKEKWVDGEWQSQGPEILCFWEGNAWPVESGESIEHPFRTNETGTWRLVYGLGLGCSDSAPLNRSNCLFVSSMKSNEYDVVEPETPDPQALCEQTGGDWALASCGHWYCGQPPLCLAIIPGCNCGAGRIFDADLGCVEDSICDQVPPCWVGPAGDYHCPLD
ncbi:MAG: hypothetical protein VCC04_08300 [Myxococcota bacterium]